MKPKTLISGALALTLVVSASSVASADDNSKTAVYTAKLSNVPVPELPTQAAKIVAQAKAKEQKPVAVAVVSAAVERSPASAPFIVSAVAKSAPVVAPAIAAAAAALQPKQAGAIAKAAALAAPAKAADIVAAVCKEVPASYRVVAIGVWEAVPSANSGILTAVYGAIPELKPTITGASPQATVPDVLASSPSVQGPPPPRPPFVPGSAQGQANRAQDILVQPGEGRIYSGP